MALRRCTSSSWTTAAPTCSRPIAAISCAVRVNPIRAECWVLAQTVEGSEPDGGLQEHPARSAVPHAPECTLTTGLNWRIAAGWRLAVDGVYVSAMRALSDARVAGAANPATVGAHFLLNARLSRLFAWKAGCIKQGEFYLAGENLTDRNFAYLPGYPIPGINFMVGMRFE